MKLHSHPINDQSMFAQSSAEIDELSLYISIPIWKLPNIQLYQNKKLGSY